MRDRGLIVAGLLLFLGVILFPLWSNLEVGNAAKEPALKLPIQAKECVAPVSYMKTSHMKLLYEWRDQAVRENRRTFGAYNGKTYTISLTGTCLGQCHTDRTQFCDRCHDYIGVRSPDCWDCHLDSRSDRLGQQTGIVLTGEQDGR